MNVVLVMFTADGERRSFSLPRPVTVIGRREDCDLRIPLGEVSRKHCRFVIDGQTLRLEDHGSSNGTFLNGERIQEAVVQPGDLVQVGPVVFTVQIDGLPADEEIQPAPANASSDDTNVAPAPSAFDNNDAGDVTEGDLDLSALEPPDASEAVDLDMQEEDREAAERAQRDNLH